MFPIARRTAVDGKLTDVLTLIHVKGEVDHSARSIVLCLMTLYERFMITIVSLDATDVCEVRVLPVLTSDGEFDISDLSPCDPRNKFLFIAKRYVCN